MDVSVEARGLSSPGLRGRIAPFALLVALAFATTLVPAAAKHAWALDGAVALAVALGVAIVLVPWSRLPAWTESLPILTFLVVVTLLRDARGGAASGYSPLALLPVVWLALYGTRRQMLVAAGAVGVTFFLPVVFLHEPVEELRRAVMWTVTAPLVGLATHGAVAAQRTAQATAGAALARLAESERRHRTIVEASGDVLFETDTAGRWTFLSPAWEQVIGRPAAGALRRSVADYLLPPDSDASGNPFAGVLAGRVERLDVEREFRRPGGELRWARVRAHALLDADGRVAGVAGTLRDVTRRKHAQLAREESEGRALRAEVRFERAFASSALGLAFVALDGRFEKVNPALQQMLGRDAEALREETIGSLCHPDDVIVCEAVLPRLLGGEVAVQLEKRWVRPDGSEVATSANASLLLDDDGRPVGLFCQYQDVTEERRVQRELRDVRALMQAVLDNADALIYAVDVDGTLVLANQAFEDISDAATAADAARFAAETERARANSRSVLESGVPQRFEERFTTADGDHVFAAAKFPLVDERGGLTGLGVVSLDVTKAKRAEERLLERERLLAEAQALAHIGSWERDLDHDFAAWSDELCRIAGQPAGSHPTLDEFLALVHPDDRALAMAASDRDVDGDHADTRYRIVRPDGSVRWVHSRRFGRADAAGRVTRLFGTIQDVTDQRDAELAREELLAELGDAVALAQLGSYSYDVAGDEMQISPQMRTLLGMSPDDPSVTFAEISAYVHPEDRDGVLRAYAASTAEGRPSEAEYRIVRRDGDVRWVHSRRHLVLDDAGEIGRVVGTLQDISERKLAEVAVATAQERFRGAFDDAPIGMAIISLEGIIEQANEALSVISGRLRSELVGLPIPELIHPSDLEVTREAMLSLVAGTTDQLAIEVRLRHPTGLAVEIAGHGTLLRDGDGRPTHMLGQFQDITERKQFESQLQYMADHDPLTGLLNRRRFESELERHVTQVKRYGAEGAVIVLDIDHFKSVNDTYGHNAGDELIVSIAQILRERLRASDLLARLGGDEFAVLLPKADADEAAHVAESLVRGVRSSTTLLNGEVKKVTTSLGVAMFDEVGDEVTGESIVIDADLAMYDAKEAGRDRYAFYATTEHRTSRTKARLTWATRIEHALANDRFALMAQPVVDLADEGVHNHELLVRMLDDDDQHIPPATFLYIAERFGLVGRLDEWVTLKVIDLLEQRDDLRLAVNVSGRTLSDQRVLASISDRLRDSDIGTGRLIFEVTELAAVANVATSRGFADRLRELGCSFALDDFGAGFGSFYYLKHLPFDYVKIDGEFVQHAASGRIDQLVIQAVVGIASGLGKKTIAEHVSTPEARRMVERLGVDFGQGDVLGKPVSIDTLRTLTGDRRG